MLPLAYFGIESSGLNLAVDLLILFVVVLYLSLIYWTYADARRRIDDPMLVGCATAASLFPFVGTIVYMILRPPEYLEDVRERELEMQAAEARLHAARPVAVPALRLPRRARLRALPELPAQAQGALRELLAPARPGVDDLPLLRGRGARALAARARAPAPRRAALEAELRRARRRPVASDERRGRPTRAPAEVAGDRRPPSGATTPRRPRARRARRGARARRPDDRPAHPSKGSHGHER